MLEIWGRPSSANVQAVMWCIGELNLAYKRHDIGGRFGGNDTPVFRSMNPNGTVPVLRDDQSEPLWESGAILRYLAGRYGSSVFWPDDALERAAIDKWAEWSKLNIATAFTVPVFGRVVRTAPSKRDPGAITAAIANLDVFLDVAEAQLSSNDFIATDGFTLADVQFGHVLFRYFDIDISRKSRPHLDRYYKSISGRAAFRKHVALDYSDLIVQD